MQLFLFILPTFAMLNRNIFEALRLSALPVIATVGMWQIIFAMLPASGESFINIMTVILVGLFGYCLTFAWFATRWHRFLLLSEPQDSVLPAIEQGILAYAARLFLLTTGLSLIGFFVGLIVGAFLPEGPTLAVGLALFILFYWLFFRLSPVLTTTALGSAITRREAWLATRGTSRACLGLGVMFVALAYLAFSMSAPHALSHPPLETMFVWTLFWLLVLLHATAISVVYDRPALAR